MLTKTKKKRAVDAVKIHDTDTGSAEVQISILSKKIDELASHLKKNKKDVSSRRGLLGMVADRRTHLRYLQKKSTRRYNAILKKVNLKK
ncbi:30S ribosomal protein S15 [Candidatus Wolfebacteria bacterium]|nr:MAG: 30S ribosomal protein S15 [Candidatus Wolfebacteria bacterium]